VTLHFFDVVKLRRESVEKKVQKITVKREMMMMEKKGDVECIRIGFSLSVFLSAAIVDIG
jgi:hypothetical protein